MNISRFAKSIVTIILGTMVVWMVPTTAQETGQTPISYKNNPSRRTIDTVDSLNRPGWIHFERCLVVTPESVEIAAQETGLLAELIVREGSLVASGQLIGKLDSDTAELEKQLAGLQLQVAQSEANDQSDIRLSEMLIEETNLQLDSSIELQNKGGISDTEVRQKKINLEQAKARLIQSKTARSQKEVKAKMANATYVLSERKLDKLKLKSPVEGTVVRVDHFPGEWVTAGTPILKVIRMDEVRVDFFVDISKHNPASLVDRRSIIRLTQGGAESEYVGRISGFAPEVSQAGLVRMHATVQNRKTGKYWTLFEGMSVEVLVPQSAE